MSARMSVAFILLGVLPLGHPTAASASDQQGVEFFEKKIRPVLVKHCYKCHSADAKSVKGGLLLDTQGGIRTGGDSGAAIVAGDDESSLLMEALRYESYEMPPSGKLPDRVIEDFATWIKMGAPDPRQGESIQIQRVIDFDKSRQFWAFRPVQRPAAPAIENEDWVRSEIDQFVMAKLEEKGLRPVADASRITLVRRLFFDLIGMGPTPTEVDSFLADKEEGAIERLVDRLLDSPHFGERWGRHWLDVARFAESNGRDRNFVYPHAWRYRDYVIQALNDDKPFDLFILEQIAGDLLPDDPQTANQRAVATGFLAIGPKALNERDKERFRMDVVDEQVDVTTRGFMALTVSCARCHDHKFDPVPTKEYYSLAGIYRSSITNFGTAQGGGNRQQSELIRLALTEAQQAKQVERTNQAILEAEQQLAAAKAKAEKSANKKLKRQVTALTAKLAKLRKEGLASDQLAMGMSEGKAEDSPVYVRGETDNPAEVSHRGYLTILSPQSPPPAVSSGSGRLDLAHWIASAENPLTGRVFVNRVWHHLVGRGIVRTVDNFGATGDRPTHPELLDHLAVTFVEDDWSVKRLIRRIVLSRTYQLSSDYHPANYATDPDNTMIWRMNSKRLEAEALRDTMLLASGSLDRTPLESSLVAKYKVSDAVGRGMKPDDLEVDFYHRSVYLPILRNAVPASLQAFDFAEPSILVGRREVTTVPAQALYLMNNDFVIEQAESTAVRILEGAATNAERVNLAYRLILNRPAMGDEIEEAIAFVNRTSDQLAEGSGNAAWSSLCQALLASGEFRYVD